MQNFKDIFKHSKYYYNYKYEDIKLLLISDNDNIISICWECEINIALQYLSNANNSKNNIISSLIVQLDEYFTHKRKTFSVKTKLIGSDFQTKVWQSLLEIEYGKTLSYKEFTELSYNKSYLRAVSSNIGRNPIPILYPCHRVIAKSNNSGGFAGGLHIKQSLLMLETGF